MPLLTLHQHPPRGTGPLSPEMVVDAIAPVLSGARRQRIERVLQRRLLSVTVVLENLHDPHNGAAAIRTCEALGLHHIHVVEGLERFSFSRKVSVHAHKWLAIYRHPTIEAALGFLQHAGFCCFAAVPPLLTGPVVDEPVEVERPVALVFGNEHRGLTRAAHALCQRRFSIPLHGFSESLNLSVSVAMTVGDVTRRRRRALGRAGDLPHAAMAQLRAAYYAQSTPHAVELVLRQLESRRY